MNTMKLNNNIQLPILGFGVYQIPDLEECEASVLHALKTGYRLIDTAESYGNEQAVGYAIKQSGIKREDIFITSKVWIQTEGYAGTMQAFEKTLMNLQTDYLDLYLMHMPYGDYHGSWRAMEDLYKAGKIKAIGVSNFLENRLVDLILTHNVVPAVNQIEMHPFHQQKALRRVMEDYHIQPMAWGPFAEGRKGIFTNDILTSIGEKYNKTAAQVIIRWFREEGLITIPKSVHTERIEENFDVDDFQLSREDIQTIEKLDEKKPLILDIRALNEVYRLHPNSK